MKSASSMGRCSRTGILPSPKNHEIEPTIESTDGTEWITSERPDELGEV